jgi:hypothetical protein
MVLHPDSGRSPRDRALRMLNEATAGLEFYGQASRPISTSQLSELPHLHLWPINLVVYEGS